MSRHSRTIVIVLIVCVLFVYLYGRSRSHEDIADASALRFEFPAPLTPVTAGAMPAPSNLESGESDNELDGELPIIDVFSTGMGNVFGPTKHATYPKGDASIEGVVVDKQGKPLAGMVVLNGGDPFSKPFPRSVTGSDGKFLLTELAPISYRVMAVPAISGGMGIDSGEQSIELAADQALTGLRLVYEGVSERTISGRVTNTKGKPLSGATVRGGDATSSIAFNSYTETGEDGRYVLETRSYGFCEVYITHPEHSGAHVTRVKHGEQNVDFVLQGLGTIVGRVVDGATSVPVTDFEAGSLTLGASSELSAPGDSLVFSNDGDGRFTLTSVDANMNLLFIRAQGYAPASFDLPQIHPGKTTELGTLRLGQGASLEGTVVDMDGRPVAGAQVQLGGLIHALYPDTRQFPEKGEGYDATTDEAGYFAIERLSAEASGYTLTHPDYPKTVGDLNLTAGQTTQVQWVMTGFATVKGRYLVDGQPVAKRSVRLEGETASGERFFGSDDTNADGDYRIDNLMAGDVAVQVHAFAHGTSRMEEVEASTTLGHTTVVDLDVEFGTATIEGTVTLDGTEPISEVAINATSVDGSDHAIATSLPGESYQINGLFGGEYEINVVDYSSPEPKHLGSARATVAAGETVVVDIECDEQGTGSASG